MSLGERIAGLRIRNRMSQGELAEKINVSRQSISKWETDASVPELERLIQLSQVFGVTLDELVKDDTQQENLPKEKEAAQVPVQAKKSAVIGTQKVIGFIFLAAGLLCVILGWIFNAGLLAVGFYVLFCGAVCLLVSKSADLVIGWVTVLLFMILAPYFTGVWIFAVFRPAFYARGFSIQIVLALAFWAFVALLAAATIYRICKKGKR